MELKLRVSYIVLVISVVILAIGIILIVNQSGPDKITLVDRTVIVPAGEDYRFFFDIPSTGILEVTVEVESGGIVSFFLYNDSTVWWTGEEGNAVIRSSFEVPIDTGNYYLNLIAPGPSYYPWRQEQGSPEARTVHVYLAFEG